MVGNAVPEFVAKLPGIWPEERRTVLSNVIQSEVDFATKTKHFNRACDTAKVPDPDTLVTRPQMAKENNESRYAGQPARATTFPSRSVRFSLAPILICR